MIEATDTVTITVVERGEIEMAGTETHDRWQAVTGVAATPAASEGDAAKEA